MKVLATRGRVGEEQSYIMCGKHNRQKEDFNLLDRQETQNKLKITKCVEYYVFMK